MWKVNKTFTQKKTEDTVNELVKLLENTIYSFSDNGNISEIKIEIYKNPSGSLKFNDTAWRALSKVPNFYNKYRDVIKQGIKQGFINDRPDNRPIYTAYLVDENEFKKKLTEKKLDLDRDVVNLKWDDISADVFTLYYHNDNDIDDYKGAINLKNVKKEDITVNSDI